MEHAMKHGKYGTFGAQFEAPRKMGHRALWMLHLYAILRVLLTSQPGLVVVGS